MEKATIYDYARVCKSYEVCDDCPLFLKCGALISEEPNKANEIILKWCKEHPIKTRQSEFLKMFPNAMKDEDVINIDPCVVDDDENRHTMCCEILSNGGGATNE